MKHGLWMLAVVLCGPLLVANIAKADGATCSELWNDDLSSDSTDTFGADSSKNYFCGTDSALNDFNIYEQTASQFSDSKSANNGDPTCGAQDYDSNEADRKYCTYIGGCTSWANPTCRLKADIGTYVVAYTDDGYGPFYPSETSTDSNNKILCCYRTEETLWAPVSCSWAEQAGSCPT